MPLPHRTHPAQDPVSCGIKEEVQVVGSGLGISKYRLQPWRNYCFNRGPVKIIIDERGRPLKEKTLVRQRCWGQGLCLDKLEDIDLYLPPPSPTPAPKPTRRLPFRAYPWQLIISRKE